MDLLELHTRYPALGSRFLKLRDRLDAPDGPEAAKVASPLRLAGTAAQQGLGGTVGTAVQAADRSRPAGSSPRYWMRSTARKASPRSCCHPRPEELTRHAADGAIVAFNIGRTRLGALRPAGLAPQLPLPKLAVSTLIEQIDTWEDALDHIFHLLADKEQTARAEATLSARYLSGCGTQRRSLFYAVSATRGLQRRESRGRASGGRRAGCLACCPYTRRAIT